MRKWLLGAPLAALAAVAAVDLRQTRYPILRTFPVLGHARMALSAIGPELRQYIVAGNDEERPFTRNQRDWVYESAEGRATTFGFGTDNDVEFDEGYPLVKQRTFSDVSLSAHIHSGEFLPTPPAKILGGARGRARAFRPDSFVTISGMSYGALAPAVGRSTAEQPSPEPLITPERAGCCTTRTVPTYSGDRHRLLRLPGRRRALRHRQARRSHREERPGDRDCSARAPNRASAVCCRREITEEISRLRGIPMGETAPARPATPRSTMSTAPGSGGAHRRPHRPAGGINRRSAKWVLAGSGRRHAAPRPRRRFHHDRRRRAAPVRAARLLRRGLAAVPTRLPRVYSIFATGLTDDVVFMGLKARHPRERGGGVRTGRGHDQRGRNRAVGRLHPGPRPHGGCLTGVATRTVAGPWSRSHHQCRALPTTSCCAES